MMQRVLAGATERPITDGNSPWNEAFTFTQAEWDALCKARPDLSPANPDKAGRLKAWKAFAQTSVGRAFRVR